MVPEIEALGATLVAISPQLPDKSLQTADQNKLSFMVLSDAGNKVARQFGLVFRLSDRLWQLYKSFGADLAVYNGDENYELPIPATYVIGVDSVICHAFVDTDYTKRLEPEEVVTVLKKITGRDK
jgi:peroxiredoxin